MHLGYMICRLAMECHRRKCDNCILRFQCFTAKWFPYPFPKHLKTNEEFEVELTDAVKYLEYHDNGVWLVWKNSRAKQKKGEFIKVFGDGEL